MTYIAPDILNMTEGGKKALKQARDHNWDLERMQFEKDKGNVSSEQDYVNKQTKQREIQADMNKEKISSKDTDDDAKLRTTSDKEC